MNNKIKRFLFELTKDNRITSKSLSKFLRKSQQSCSYLINMLERKKLIQKYNIIVDAVKLGFTNVVVGFNYLNFDKNIKKDLLEELKNNESIISIEEAKQGVDLIVEYSSRNLSAFNKIHSEIIDKFNKVIKTRFVLPIIVKHKFEKNYLAKKNDYKDTILCGDRKTIILSKREQAVLNELVKEADTTLIELSKNTKISIKSVAAIKKNLERKAIIKGYSCILNNERLGIKRYLLFLKVSNPSIKVMAKLIEFAKLHRNIVEFIKIIGEFQVILIIEELNNSDIIKDIRENFQVENYFVVESENILKKEYLPFVN